MHAFSLISSFGPRRLPGPRVIHAIKLQSSHFSAHKNWRDSSEKRLSHAIYPYFLMVPFGKSCRPFKKLFLAVFLEAAAFEMGLLCFPYNDGIAHTTISSEFCAVCDVRARRTHVLGHIYYELWSRYSTLINSSGNPDGITPEMREDSMTFGGFQKPELECSVMH
jgi:hypothetical protein